MGESGGISLFLTLEAEEEAQTHAGRAFKVCVERGAKGSQSLK